MKSISIIGAGGLALCIAEAAQSIGFKVSHFIAENAEVDYLMGIPVLSGIEKIPQESILNLAIGIGDNFSRERVSREISSKFPNVKFPSIIHQSATIASNAIIKSGVICLPQAYVGPLCVVEDFALLNAHASLDHEGVMKSFSSLAPNVATGGRVYLGNRSVISIGASIKHNVRIENDVVIGANSYVNRDIPSLVVAYGCPAKIIRTRLANEPYF